MQERERYRPFTGDSERRIQLEAPPLPLVLCQVRWPELTQLQAGLDQHAARVAELLKGYPFHEQSREVAVTLTPEGVSSGPGEPFHQWHSGDQAWHIALTKRSIALFATNYSSFEDFHPRLLEMLESVAAVIDVPVVERIGLRHVNRIVDAIMIDQLDDKLEPAVLGLAPLRVVSPDVKLLSSLGQAVYSVGADQLQVRSGLLAPYETVDPAVPPVEARSWVLDIDASRTAPGSFNPRGLVEIAGRLADINYDFFKLIVKDAYVASMEGAS